MNRRVGVSTKIKLIGGELESAVTDAGSVEQGQRDGTIKSRAVELQGQLCSLTGEMDVRNGSRHHRVVANSQRGELGVVDGGSEGVGKRTGITVVVEGGSGDEGAAREESGRNRSRDRSTRDGHNDVVAREFGGSNGTTQSS